jgi:histidyl-tRNA synthetase
MFQTEPVRKLYYAGPMFRRERPQKGRLRQFYQIGAEVLGRGDPQADAEVLLLLADFFNELGIAAVGLELNSLGCVRCRPAYRERLLEFLRGVEAGLCENCRRRMERNPLRVLDCKEESCAQVTRDAPAMIDFLCADCRDHFDAVKRLLTSSGLEYSINPRMVRGLDYYCRTTFEWTTTQLGAQNAVAAGGRYDGLVEDLGGPHAPGVGFALGMERLVLLLGMKETIAAARPALYIAWLGSAAQAWAFPLARALRQKQLIVEMEGEERSLKSLMRRADKAGARYVLIAGDDELRKGKAVIRHMEGKEQYEIDMPDIERHLVERLSGR